MPGLVQKLCFRVTWKPNSLMGPTWGKHVEFPYEIWPQTLFFSSLSSLTELVFITISKGRKLTNGCGGSFLPSTRHLSPAQNQHGVLSWRGELPPKLFVPYSNFCRHSWSRALKIDFTPLGSFSEHGRTSICLILAPSLLLSSTLEDSKRDEEANINEVFLSSFFLPQHKPNLALVK